MLSQKLSRSIFLLQFCAYLIIYTNARAQNDLPNPSANIQLIPTGSLVIPMDNTWQLQSGYFNLKAYGLVNYLLQNNVPVKWAIRAGKLKDEIDFSADAQRIRPSVGFSNWYDFKCGPFIVDSSHAAAAKTLAAAFGGSVAVYQLTANKSIDIRYTLNFKPKIAVCNNGGTQAVFIDVLTAASMNNASWVTVVPASQVVPFCGYTFVSEPHWEASGDTAHTRAVYRYVKNGGNFFTQCRGVETYEDADTFHTTKGVNINNVSTMAYFNGDLPIMQFDGSLAITSGGLQFWQRASGSLFRSTTYTGVQSTGSTPYQYLNGAKLVPNNVAGGNVFYLGGHEYTNTTSHAEINGRRIYLNAIFVPPNPLAWCSTLPVKLLYFQGIPEDSKVTLRWSTATEINNDYFKLERSSDGIEYTLFKEVKGAGNSSSVSFYLAEDLLPLSGESYYRLTQVDYDGQTEVFDPVKVEFKLKPKNFSIYPNPATEGINISVMNGAIVNYTIELSDLCSKSVIATTGVDKNQSGNFFWKFPNRIHPGIYSLKISDGSKEEVFKLLIQDRPSR